MNLFWEMYQNRRIRQADEQAIRAQTAASSVNEQLRQMEDTIAVLALKCQAMWELLKENSELTDSQLAEKISQVDMRDGVPDSRITRAPKVCPECGRTAGGKHRQCIYCGNPMEGFEIFET